MEFRGLENITKTPCLKKPLFKKTLVLTSGLYMECTWNVHGMYMECIWNIVKKNNRNSPTLNGDLPTPLPSPGNDFHGFPMDLRD